MRWRFLLSTLLCAGLLAGCAENPAAIPTDPEESTMAHIAAKPEKNTMEVLNPRMIAAPVDPQNSDFVSVEVCLPEMEVDLKYATEDNFTGQVIYDFQSAYLRWGTLEKLRLVSRELEEKGLRLKLWDGFRPMAAHVALWEAYPDPMFVADPAKSFSNHCRGNTVDVTLVYADGREVEMPTEFDDFSPMADRDYSDCTPQAAENAMLLQTVMERHGFTGYFGEWWHFADTDRYDVETCFDPAAICRKTVVCQEYLTLRQAPDTASREILRLPAGVEVTFLGYLEEFSLVDFWGKRGYVLTEYLQ